METNYVIGLDFGTDSVRALLVDAADGKEISTAVCGYPRWLEGLYCNAKIAQYRQHPLDYLEAMETCILTLLKDLQADSVANIRAISIGTTGSTIVAVDEAGTPLAMQAKFAENPNAMFVLWKDHSAHIEANDINELAKRWEIDYTKFSGGTYSPEWFWSKVLYLFRNDLEVAAGAYSFLEHCDWIPAVLTGNKSVAKVKRSRCAAGHKAMWHEDFSGLPSATFLATLDPRLGEIRTRLYEETYTVDVAAGTIDLDWANRLGLPVNVKIGVGAFDAHVGAVGAGIVPNALVKVMGTSTCDMLVANETRLVKGICGQVNGSILPGMVGMEAGQSAFGDLYKWFEQLLSYPLAEFLKDELNADTLQLVKSKILGRLNEQAAQLPVELDDELSLDWINGRRTPDANLALKAAITGLSLGSTAPSIFKSLVEATCFGAKAIIDCFVAQGIAVNKVIVLGGISKKSPYVLQTLANVLGKKIEVVKSEQACALGSAMIAATIAGVYPKLQDAQVAMSSGFDQQFLPAEKPHLVYQKRYLKYQELGANLG